MNQYTELLQYIYDLGTADVFINTITQGEPSEVDINRGNIMPLLHIVIDSAGLTNGSTINFNLSLECLTVRDINKEVVTDKFWKQDNEVDNHNETFASLNRIWTIMYRDFQDKDINALENPTLDKVTLEGSNLLDGWRLSTTIELPNKELNLCQ